MPIDYYVDERRNHVLTIATGPIDDAELLALHRSFVQDSRVRPGFRALFDARHVSSVGVTQGVLDGIAQLEAEADSLFRFSKTAIVAHHHTAWRLAKYFESRAPGTVIVFSHLDLAQKWLGHED